MHTQKPDRESSGSGFSWRVADDWRGRGVGRWSAWAGARGPGDTQVSAERRNAKAFSKLKTQKTLTKVYSLGGEKGPHAIFGIREHSAPAHLRMALRHT
eukprot:1032306-Prymnesium_polylepis.1